MPDRPGFACDASVLINLIATNRLAEILRALDTPAFVTDQVFAEVHVDPRDRKRNPDVLGPFVASGVLLRVTLDDTALETFLDLTGAEPDGLDDGESATIAYAIHRGSSAVLDESKARVICSRSYPHLHVVTTVDLLRSDAVRDALGEDGATEAIFQALRLARMSVPTEHAAWVRQVLGPERVGLCSSLRRRP